MRGKLPAYLSRDQRGNYHFRARVPKALQPHLRKSEIRRSLGTDSYREAVRLARAYRVEFDKFCEEAMRKKKKIKPLALGYTVIGPITFADGRRIDKIEIDHPDPEAERKLVASALASIAQSEAPAPQPEAPKSPLLSEIIDRYIREKTGLNHWKDRSVTQVQATLRDFLEITGDGPITEITRQTITEFATTFAKLPPNRNKRPEFKDKPIAEIVKMTGFDPINATTLRNNLNRVSAFLKWAKQNHLIEQNPAENATHILPKKARQKRKIDAREPFTTEELQRLFHSDEFKKPKSPYQYWVPIIGLYSGARLEEICSLKITDIKQDDNIWYFDITDTKTEAGSRQTPIHNRLIELGLLSYIERLKSKGQERLFPELKPNRFGETHPIASKWFARFRDRCGIGENDGRKVFHSFRHNVVDFFKQKMTPPEAIHAIVGHEDKIAHGIYGKRYQAASLKSYIDQLAFDVNIPKFDWGDKVKCIR